MTIKRLTANEFATLTANTPALYTMSADAQNQATIELKLTYLRELVGMSRVAQQYAAMLPNYQRQTQTYPDMFRDSNLEAVFIEADALVMRACTHIENASDKSKRASFFFHSADVTKLMNDYKRWLG